MLVHLLSLAFNQLPLDIIESPLEGACICLTSGQLLMVRDAIIGGVAAPRQAGGLATLYRWSVLGRIHTSDYLVPSLTFQW